ncbi:MAG: ISAs1 family transposase [Acetobacteraceae bacterium]|nr:ISAs1 family transposase [Acetobacteraceae bacterium]
MQLVSRHRHLHRRPPTQAERGVRSELAPSTGAHRRPLHPSGARSGRGGGRLPPPCRLVAGGARHARTGQHRPRWQNPARQLRQVPRPRRRPGAQRLRHRHRPGARACRHRREVQRDPGGAGAARRTRRRPRRPRHARRAALPKKHFEAAATAGVALIVGVKDNQPTLRQRVQEVSATTAPLGSAHSRDTGRNRDERRTVAVFDPTDRLADTDWHPHVAAIVRVERDVSTRSAATGLLRHSAETAFYVSNTPLTATRAAEAIRAHWTIENTSHYSRDVTLGEDRSRIRTNPGVFARLRSFAFNILKANRTDTLSQDRYRAGLMGIKDLLRMLVVSQR